MSIPYGIGIDIVAAILDAALKYGVVEKRGAWFSFDGEQLAQGREASLERLRGDEELCQKLMQMAKFRNRLVHLYGEIDNKYVYGFLNNDLEDIRSYRKTTMQRYKI